MPVQRASDIRQAAQVPEAALSYGCKETEKVARGRFSRSRKSKGFCSLWGLKVVIHAEFQVVRVITRQIPVGLTGLEHGSNDLEFK